MSNLTFHEESHTYWTPEGKFVPNVSLILEDTGICKPLPEFLHHHLARGTAYHLACELWDKGILDEESVDPEIQPYLDGWKQFAPCVDEWLLIEEVLHGFSDTGDHYAGTADRVAIIGGQTVLIDIKGKTQSRWHTIQAQAYIEALEVDCDIYVDYAMNVHLNEEGTFEVKEFDRDRREASTVWNAAITTYWFKNKFANRKKKMPEMALVGGDDE